ncbi:prepilin-type N-terminal cleavage/methylation domain-containing protein [Cellulomonas sp. DKR-3]|uniref:Prepilin-type N-terminal cleavage/methylation domain-containing protein n=1 Tax=Cellulomonas fulva TaxID=2835530 RepID=A0ABS5U1H8_9CELL|nr:prepilin-type N-terminal cleavage/methylation domain-containing protein [Cellulomonas fulva]MBT0995202.1 prepilin-type N-terminal cleavage/methylation domain-containing protein [Cellulomonas fulva]
MRIDDRPRTGDESGFTLMELLVAMMIIGGVLLGLAAVQTSALVSTAQTRQRTLGTAVTNQVMEQLRALPWNTLNKGLRTGFVGAAGGDPNVDGTRLRPAVGDDGIDEALVTSSDQATTMAPLSGAGGSNLTRTRNPEAPGIVFTSRSYVSRPADGTAVLSLTVITTWRANQSSEDRFVVLRSAAYAPQGGCGDPDNQPFLGACQALFSASAGGTGPEITVTAAAGGAAGDPVVDATTPILPGTSATVASLRVAQTGVGIAAQQSSTAEATVLHSGGTLTAASDPAAAESTGASSSSLEASNDLGSVGAAPADPAPVTSTGVASSLSLGQGDLTMLLQPGGGDQATVRASTVTSCATGIANGEPCASTTARTNAPTSVTASVRSGTFAVATVGSSASTTTFGGRFTKTAGTTATGCTSLTGAGCVAAGVSRSLGTVTLGGGSWTGGAASSGLIVVNNYTDSTRVERGASQPAATPVTTRTGSIRYWNGSSYSTLTLGTGTSSSKITGSVSWTGGGYTVTASGSVLVTPASTLVTAADAGCAGEGCSLSSETGLVTISVRYRMEGPSGVHSFVVATTLGGARAAAGYKAAPSA